MTTISTRTRYEKTDGWRGRVVPVNAVGAANDTGTWRDSPCPSHLVKAEKKTVVVKPASAVQGVGR